MMKKFKLFLLSFALITGLFTSCSNEDSVTNDQDIQQTEAITTSLNRLAEQFNDDGDVIPTSNPSGNIVFDFGFDFVYPLNLSFNNGTTVAVNSLDELIEILINSTDDLYINGIEFPFEVEIYDEDTDSIIVVTINSEEEFLDLLDSLWDDQDPCDCDDDVVNPVCVEVQDPNGESFIITYPNECYALCDGFTPNDFAENCEDDYNCPGGFECFEFNFPISIITDEDVTITVNSQEELDNALYNTYYFDFVYPFEVTTDEGEVVTINNADDFYDVLEDCFDDYENECDECLEEEIDPVCVEVQTATGLEIITFPNACYAECEGFDEADFVDCDNNTDPCIECENEPYDPVCVEVEEGGQVYTYTFPNACYAECEGFDEEDFVDCDNNNPDYCSEQELFAFLLQCNWYINTSLYDTAVAEYAHFTQDGTVTISTDGGTSGVSGSWDLSSAPATGQLFMFLNFNDAPYNAFTALDWTVTECSEYFIVLSSGNEFIMLERDCD